MQRLVLAHLHATGPLRLGARDAHRRVVNGDRNIVGPRVAVHLVRQRPLPRGLEPSLASEIAQRARRRPADDRHGLVPRLADDAGRQASARVVIKMLGRVPAVGGDVAAAAEGQLIVDDHHLLVMTGADGPGRIQPELDHALAEPALRLVRIEALRRRDQQRRLPDQQPDVQVRPAPHQHSQLVPDLGLLVPWPGVGVQMGARIELPAQDHHRPLRLGQGGRQGREIGVVLHQHGEAVRLSGAPQARPRFEQTAFVAFVCSRHPISLPDSPDNGIEVS